MLIIHYFETLNDSTIKLKLSAVKYRTEAVSNRLEGILSSFVWVKRKGRIIISEGILSTFDDRKLEGGSITL